MTSGNFLIGSRLSWEGFDTYVKPALNANRITLNDLIMVNAIEMDSSLLASLSSEGDVEKSLNKALIDSITIINVNEKNRRENGEKNQIAWEHQVKGNFGKGAYFTIGVYQDNLTASRLFPSIAEKYMMAEIEKKADYLRKEIKSLLQKKLSEL